MQCYPICRGIRGTNNAQRNTVARHTKHIPTTGSDGGSAIHRPVASCGLNEHVTTCRGHISIGCLYDRVPGNDSDIARSAANQCRLPKLITCFKQNISIGRADLRINVNVSPGESVDCASAAANRHSRIDFDTAVGIQRNMAAAAGDRASDDKITVVATSFQQNIAGSIRVNRCRVGSTFDRDRAVLGHQLDGAVVCAGEIFQRSNRSSFRGTCCTAPEIRSHDAIDIDRDRTGEIDSDRATCRNFTQIDAGGCIRCDGINIDVQRLIVDRRGRATRSANDRTGSKA